MIVGQSIGTAATSAAPGTVGGGLAVRRAGPAHIIFSVFVGVAGGTVALEAAWRALLEVAHGLVDIIRRRLAEAVQQINHFLESLSFETADLAAIEPRLARVCHALDRLTQLHDDLRRVPPAVDSWEPPTGFGAGAQALSAWLSVSKDSSAMPAPPVFDALEAASKQLTVGRHWTRYPGLTERCIIVGA